jgi:hypothetical protein
MATKPIFFSKIAMNDYFQQYRNLTPTDFWPKNCPHQKSKNVIYGKETYVGEVYEPLSMINGHTTPIFVKNNMNNHCQ